jgi:hypothetical protein
VNGIAAASAGAAQLKAEIENLLALSVSATQVWTAPRLL